MDVKKKVIEIADIYKNATLSVFTTFGLVFTILLTLLFFSFYLINFNLNLPTNLLTKPVPIFHFDIIAIIVAILSSIITMAIWWILGTKYAPKVGALLTEHKLAHLLLTKGDIHYFEKVDRKTLRINVGTIIGKFINLLLSWFAVTAFLLGFLLTFFNGTTSATSDKLYAFITSEFVFNNLSNYILKLLIVFVLGPILMTITVPIPWMLLDSHLKAYSSSSKINSFVGKAVQTRLNSVFALGGFITLILQNLSLNTIVLVIVFIFGILAFPSMLMITLYNMLFQVQYYETFLKAIPVPFGTTKIEMEIKFNNKVETTVSDTISNE